MTKIKYIYISLAVVLFWPLLCNSLNSSILSKVPDYLQIIILLFENWFLLFAIIFINKKCIHITIPLCCNVSIFSQIIVGLLIGLFTYFSVIVVCFIVQINKVSSVYTVSNASAIILLFFYSIFVVGLVEEFIFRGYLYSLAKVILQRYKHVHLDACLLSSLLFSIIHLICAGFLQFCFTFIMGCIYCFVLEKDYHVSLLSLIIAHGLYNLLIHIHI